MDIKFAIATDIGQKRKVNEDSGWPAAGPHAYGPNTPYGALFIVADGMGGHGSGDIASQLAVAAISTEYYALDQGYPNIGDRLQLAIKAAFHQICDRAAQSAETEDMGTTVVAAVVKNNEETGHPEAWLAWAGDSRGYLLRAGRLLQITRDHSRVWPLLEGGYITWDALHFHPNRSRVTNALTPRRAEAAPEIQRLDLEPGDRLLLCSDGLSGEVRPEMLEKIAASYPPDHAAPLLIEQANASKDVWHEGQLVNLEGGNDNITVIIVEIMGQPGQPAVAPLTTSPADTLVASAPLPRKSSRLGLLRGGFVVVFVLLAAGLSFIISGTGLLQTAAVAPQVPASPAAPATAQNSIIIAVESNADTPAPTLPPATATEPAAQAAGAPAPTVTRGPTSSPTAVPTNTPPPAALATAATAPITATAAITSALPVLLQPPADSSGTTLLDVSRKIVFAWEWSGELTNDLSFEIMVWRQGATPTGAHDARFLKQDPDFKQLGNNRYSAGLVLKGAGGIVGTGSDYLWTVGVVRINPAYESLGLQAPPRPISILVPAGQAGPKSVNTP